MLLQNAPSMFWARVLQEHKVAEFVTILYRLVGLCSLVLLKVDLLLYSAILEELFRMTLLRGMHAKLFLIYDL